MIDVTTKRRTKASLRLDLLKAFGADFQLNIRDTLFFAGENGKAIIYPVGHHIAIRDIFVREELRKNDPFVPVIIIVRKGWDVSL